MGKAVACGGKLLLAFRAVGNRAGYGQSGPDEMDEIEEAKKEGCVADSTNRAPGPFREDQQKSGGIV